MAGVVSSWPVQMIFKSFVLYNGLLDSTPAVITDKVKPLETVIAGTSTKSSQTLLTTPTPSCRDSDSSS